MMYLLFINVHSMVFQCLKVLSHRHSTTFPSIVFKEGVCSAKHCLAKNPAQMILLKTGIQAVFHRNTALEKLKISPYGQF